MSWKATAYVKELHDGLRVTDKFVLLILADYHRTDDKSAWPSVHTLAKDCLMTERGVRNILSRLETHGFIGKISGCGRGNVTGYQISGVDNKGGTVFPLCEEIKEERRSTMSGKRRNGEEIKAERQSIKGGTATYRNKEEPIEPIREPIELVSVDAQKQHAAELIYSAYPRKVGKGNAIPAIMKALERLLKGEAPVPLKTIPEAGKWLHNRVMTYAASDAGNNGKFTPHPATWFNRTHYLDGKGEWDRRSGDERQQISKAQQRFINNCRAVGLDEEADAITRAHESGNGKGSTAGRTEALGNLLEGEVDRGD